MEIVQCFGHHAYFGATYVQVLQLYSNPNLYTQAKTCTSQHWGFYQVVEMKRFENQIKTLIKNVSKDTVQGLTLGFNNHHFLIPHETPRIKLGSIERTLAKRCYF